MEGDFIHQADADEEYDEGEKCKAINAALKNALSSAADAGDNSPGSPTHLSTLDPNGVCPFSGQQFGSAETLASHLAQALAEAVSPTEAGAQPYEEASKHLGALMKEKSWSQMQEDLALPFDVNEIVEDMGVEEEAKVEAVVKKLVLAKRWKSKNMLKHYRILEAIAVSLTDEYFS